MTNTLSTMLAAILLVACGQGNPNANPQAAAPSDAAHSIPVMTVSPDKDTPVVPFGEAFYPDGTWHFAEQQRVQFNASGLWSVSGSQVCVKITRTGWNNDLTDRKVCRQLPRLEGGQTLFGTIRNPDELLPMIVTGELPSK